MEGYETGTICSWHERGKICVQKFDHKYMGKIF